MSQAAGTMYGLLIAVVGSVLFLTVIACSSQGPAASPAVSKPAITAPSTLAERTAPAATPTPGSTPRPTTMTTEELDELEEAFNTTDVAITAIDAPDSAVAGEELVYTIIVKNIGPNPADYVRVVDTFAPGVSYVADSAGCLQQPSGTLTCDIGSLPARETSQITVTVLIAAHLLRETGQNMIITNAARVSSLAGPPNASPSIPFDHVWPDPDLSNNTASEDTLVIAPPP